MPGAESLSPLLLWELTAGLIGAGLIGGMLTGLLGVGGGIVIVPMLFLALNRLGLDPSTSMRVALGTSIATVFPTKLVSIRTHNARNSVDWALVRHWSPYIVLGAVAGAMVIAMASGVFLSILFAGVAIVVAAQMAFVGEQTRLADRLPRGLSGAALAAGIAAISTAMGLGGGTLGVPALTLFGQPIRRAVGTATGIGIVMSAAGLTAIIAAGWNAPGLPWESLGYVNLVAFALITPPGMVAAPFGASLAHRVQQTRLKRIFAVFIAIVAARMIYAVTM